eukprot:scaffold2265_cov98-Cylindrotheca_fusiformis.AAC.3
MSWYCTSLGVWYSGFVKRTQDACYRKSNFGLSRLVICAFAPSCPGLLLHAVELYLSWCLVFGICQEDTGYCTSTYCELTSGSQMDGSMKASDLLACHNPKNWRLLPPKEGQ